jgi:2'-5' RNA ligase
MERYYSIWLVPGEETPEFSKLQGLIQEYSDSLETPKFRPHVTLATAGVIERQKAEEAFKQLASSRSPFEISLSTPYCSTTRTRCFFLLADPSKQLMNFHKEAIQSLDQDIAPYTPHLSLAYGDIPFQTRVELVESFPQDSLPLSFSVKKLELIEVEGSLDEYESVDEFIRRWESIHELNL